MSAYLLIFMQLCACQLSVNTLNTQRTTRMQNITGFLDIYYKYCPLNNCEAPVNNLTEFKNGLEPCCERCFCDNDCVKYNDCCLDAIIASDIEPRTTCALPALRKRLGGGNGISVIHACPDIFSNASIRNLCYEDPRVSEWRDAALVTDPRNDKTYWNVYCAICNNLTEKDVLYWQPYSLECRSDYFFPVDMDDLLRNIWDTKCNLIFSSPPNVQTESCLALISECNFTGRWTTYNKTVEDICHMFTERFTVQTYYLFQNVFCYMCNEAKEPAAVCTPFSSSDLFHPFVSFSAILNFTTDGSRSSDEDSHLIDINCSPQFVYDPFSEECRKVHCLFGRRYINGTCEQDMLQSLTAIDYQVTLRLTPNLPMSASDADELSGAIVQETNSILFRKQDYYICLSRLFYASKSEDDDHILYFLYELHIDHPGSVIDFTKSIFSILNTTHEFFKGVNPLVLLLELSWTLDSHDDESFVKAGFVFTFVSEYSGNCIHLVNGKSKPLIIYRTMYCPLIKLSRKEFHWDISANGIKIHDLNIFETENNFLEKEKGAYILLCLDAYLPKATAVAAKRKERVHTDDTILLIDYFTFMCVSLSVICLSFTILSYLIFSSLRTQAGIYNIIMSTALVLSQLLFQFGNEAKTEISYLACAILGLLTHFFWLFVVLWMNICSIHMMRVFTNPTAEQKCKKKTNALYAFYVVCTSSVFVVSNIGVSLVRSSGRSLGYADDEKCYISSHLMFGLTFALPTGLVVIANICLYLVTVFNICRVQIVQQTDRQSRNVLLIYVCLSALTGLTWVFGFLYTLTEHIAFEYLFSIFNGGQGVFVMIAFVVNKKILTLYKSFLCKCLSSLRASSG